MKALGRGARRDRTPPAASVLDRRVDPQAQVRSETLQLGEQLQAKDAEIRAKYRQEAA